MGSENPITGLADADLRCAAEDDYHTWNDELTMINYSALCSSDYRICSESSDAEFPNKRAKNNSQELASKKIIGKIFFKTKLCCKFRSGTCPHTMNCNFAHSMEELRRPPPNWQQIVVAQEETENVTENKEEFQIPSVGGVETQRAYKSRHCKKFSTEEGCPYGDNCSFLHDEKSKNRESVVISLGPGGYGGHGGATGGGGGKPPNWKTRICNKWEVSGYCPFGDRCHFAHGIEELHSYGGRLEPESRESSSFSSKEKLEGPCPRASMDPKGIIVNSLPCTDMCGNHGFAKQRSDLLTPRTLQSAHLRWKDPHKINGVYGDWIDD